MENNKEILERYNLAFERIKQINVESAEEMPMDSMKEYFIKTTDFIVMLNSVLKKIIDGSIMALSSKELKKINECLYEDTLEGKYEKGFLCPDYAFEQFNKDFDEKEADAFAKMLSALFVQLRTCIAYSYQKRYEEITTTIELFIEIYGIIADEISADVAMVRKAVKNAMYYFAYDYADEYMENAVAVSVDEKITFVTDIVMNSDLNKTDYLYSYGEYVSENEIGISKHLAVMKQDAIDAMAATYVDGYVEGFKYAGIDLSTKKTVNIRFNIGFERIIKSAVDMFEKMDLKPVMYMNSADYRKLSPRKVGVCATGPNNQYDYDHRYDLTYFVNKSLLDRYITCTRAAYEKYSDMAAVYAGPAVIEVFGEKPFVPVNGEHSISPDKKIMKLMTAYNQERGILIDEFINLSQTSFTIIAYPLPEIGRKFKEIFDETVVINTLDKVMYRDIQEKIINTLDKAQSVHICGMNGNKTDLTVSLCQLNDPENETKFENCLADVNIPVGEVFTSPKLAGTNGILNVSRVYLNGLEYRNLTVRFKDGMISDYGCDNFEDKEAGRKYFEENVMFGHESLPMGEFAIGTNTAAYVMGRKYDISDKLPILIAEKTGPHFAVGDTCYSMSEDNRVYNPDGKEIIAKDNEVSVLRKTDMEKAYFNCHTDITIPYDELGFIDAVDYEGNTTRIIENGRFVLFGTEKLNEALDYQ